MRRVEAGRHRRRPARSAIEPAIEVGNIFKLGTRYSEPLGATYLDEEGSEQPIWMGSYGIGPARIAAAAVEQFADEKGISWPRALAPWQVHLVGLGKAGTPERDAAEALYDELQAAGVDVALRRPRRRAGREVRRRRAARLPAAARRSGAATLEAGVVEAQVRRGRAELSAVPLREGAAQAVDALLREQP